MLFVLCFFIVITLFLLLDNCFFLRDGVAELFFPSLVLFYLLICYEMGDGVGVCGCSL